MRRAMGGATWIAAACLLAALAGCDRARVRECNTLNQRINEGVARVEAHEAERRQRPGGGPAQTAQDMRKLADIYEQQASSINAMDLSDKELKNRAVEYAAALTSAAGSARALATALENNRPEEAMVADRIYADTLGRQKATVAKINAYCSR